MHFGNGGIKIAVSNGPSTRGVRMQTKKTNRRCFLKTTAAALAVPHVIPAAVLGEAGRPGANDRIRVGLIGAGNRSIDLTKESPADLKLVAVADCDLRMIAAYLGTVRRVEGTIVAENCARYQDYRQMLAKEKLDGVFVATTTHARVLACIRAMQAGLDVYAEKPLTLTIEEGQRLVRAERKFGTVFQVGTQQRSIAINNFGSDLVRDGAIGKVHAVKCPNFPGPRPRPALPTQTTPAEMDWDLLVRPNRTDAVQPRVAPGPRPLGSLSRILRLARDRLGPRLRSDPAGTGDRRHGPGGNLA